METTENAFYSDANKKVLMIDDDAKLCRLIEDYLLPFGFSVTSTDDGLAGLEKIKKSAFNAVILDAMLPGTDGLTVLKQIRQVSNVPVLLMSALGGEADRIIGLETGADDYLPKIFSTRELLARLRAVTRRAQACAAPTEIESEETTVGNICVNASRREVWLDGQPLNLTALEFDLLYYLTKSAGKVLNRDLLLDKITGRNYVVFDRSIDVHISSLRRKLGEDSKNPRYIKTIRSVGYMLTTA